MPLPHLPPTATPDTVVAALRSTGACVVDDLAGPDLLDRLEAEMAPHVAATPHGVDDHVGRRTRRTGALVARSPAGRVLVGHPLVLAVAALVLPVPYQLHLTQVISVDPGETDQPLHRDEGTWGSFPVPASYDLQCNTLWALTDFTAANGATRVLPGTHLDPTVDPARAAATTTPVRAEMRRGSVLIYSGKVVHGAGANRSAAVRTGCNITYSVDWVRQEENQYLSTPPAVARTLDDDLLRLVGYRVGGLALGYFRDFEDPLAAVRDGPVAPVDLTARSGADDRDRPGVAGAG